MLGEKLSFNTSNSNKEENAKRKLSTTEEESDSNYTTKTAKITNDDYPKLYFKRTNAYTQVVAKPGSLPNTPKIFQFNNDRETGENTFDPFLHDLLTVKTFNTDVNERFSNIVVSNKKKSKKIKKKKVKKEKTPEEKLERSIRNREKKEQKKLIKQKFKEINEAESSADNDMSDSKMNNVDLYKVVNKNGLIFHMHHPSRFSFNAEVKVTAISGAIEVLGYTLTSSSPKNSVDIYSPQFYTPLTVETKKPVNENSPAEDVQNTLKNFLTQEDYNKLLSKLKPNDSVLFVEQIISSFGIVMNKYFEKELFPKDLENISTTNKTLKILQGVFTFQLTKKVKHIKKNPMWDRIPLGRCTALCGGKGVGKSTLLKYYINKFATAGERVLCLDLDPGQPEFTFPGCISAVVIDKPLIGPNFTHLTEPFVMTCFGDVEVTRNPLKYLNCVKYVVECCKQNEELLKLKWFVNTMGFCKGLGVSLMITILKLIHPDTVIQIKGRDYKNNYPFYLTSTAVSLKSGYKSMPLDEVSVFYDLRVVYSCAEHENKQLQGGLKNRELKDVMVISYFSKMVSPPFYNFNAVQPYLISFSKLYLGIDFIIHPNDVLKAFNGNIVSFSHFECENEEIFSVHSEEDEYFKVVVQPRVTPTFGMGFVRGIDCKEKKIYVITHLPVEIMDNVNCLSLVRVCPPHSMFFKQDTVDGQATYTTWGTFDVFQRVKRMFRGPRN